MCFFDKMTIESEYIQILKVDFTIHLQDVLMN